jgi:hypothetical protein
MVRINARRIISVRAIMLNLFSVWNRTIMKQPRGAVGGNCCASSASVNMAVPPGIFGRSPQPTPVCFADLGPESGWESSRKTLRGEVLGRNLDHSVSCVRLGLLALLDASIFNPVVN